MTIQEFIEKYKIRFTCNWADKNPNMAHSLYMHRHFRCVLRRGRKSMVVYFSQGDAHTKDPTCADVLDCLASDSSGLDQSFESWASDLGYDTDSLSAFKTFKTCKRQTDRLKTVLGDTQFDELLRCERM